MSELNTVEFNAAVVAVASAEGKERERLVGAVFHQLMEHGMLTRWTRTIARRNGVRDQDVILELEQVVSEKILVTLRDLDGKAERRTKNWAGLLYGMSRNAVADYLSSSQVSGMSKMTGELRRARIATRATKELIASLGRSPTRAEVIAHANEWSLREHSNARKQGLLLSEDNFPVMGALYADLEDVTHSVSSHDAVELSAELSLVLARVRAISQEMFPDDSVLEAVSQAWVNLVSVGVRVRSDTVAEELHLTPTPKVMEELKSALRRLGLVHERMREEG